MSSSTKNKSPNENRTWQSLIIWALLALILRWQVLEPRWIPSGSMLPTLQLQDKILVEKIRPRLNFSLHKHLKRQTLIVFRPPELLVRTGYDANSALIKRIIGIPGDQIAIHDGKLFLNNKLIEEPWINEPINYKIDAFIVPANSLWVLGDNRNNSLDSHLWGPLPEKNVIGTAVFRYWPINQLGPIRFPPPSKIEA